VKKELESSKASFKLDIIETANADPMVSPADLKVLVAFISVMEWPSCKAWLASTLGQAKTGLSDRQFRESRDRLSGKNDAKRAYLLAARKARRVSTFVLVNPWRDEALDHIEAMLGHKREVERQRKATKRAALSRQNVPGQNGPVPAEFAGLSRQNLPPSTPYGEPQEKRVDREEDHLGGNVVPFNAISRRSA